MEAVFFKKNKLLITPNASVVSANWSFSCPKVILGHETL